MSRKTLRILKISNMALTRRDRSYVVALRMLRLTPEQKQIAWDDLAMSMDEMSLMHMPKYRDLMRAIRRATIKARRKQTAVYEDIHAPGNV